MYDSHCLKHVRTRPNLLITAAGPSHWVQTVTRRGGRLIQCARAATLANPSLASNGSTRRVRPERGHMVNGCSSTATDGRKGLRSKPKTQAPLAP